MQKPQSQSRSKLVPCLILSFLLFSLFTSHAAASPEDRIRSLTGHVFSSQNQPIAKAVVYLKNTKTLAVKTFISEADGTYRFPALAPDIDYEVYAQFNGARSDTKTLSAFDSRKQAVINLKIR